MADDMSPCPVCEKADLVRQDRIVDLAETLAGWEVATSARFPPLLWARFRGWARPFCTAVLPAASRVSNRWRPSTPTSTEYFLSTGKETHIVFCFLYLKLYHAA